MIDQLTVLLTNRPGTLKSMVDVLARAKVQIHALSIDDSADFGIVRLICDRPDYAVDQLRKTGFTTSTTKVLAVEVDNVPGGLAAVLTRLASVELNIMYAYTCPLNGRAIDIISVAGDPVNVKLSQAHLPQLTQEDFA